MAKYLFYRNNLGTINRQTMFCYAIKEADFFPPTLIAKVFRLGLMRLVTHCTKSIGICSKIKLRLLFLINDYYVLFLKTFSMLMWMFLTFWLNFTQLEDIYFVWLTPRSFFVCFISFKVDQNRSRKNHSWTKFKIVLIKKVRRKFYYFPLFVW